jgi:hypothetical protein
MVLQEMSSVIERLRELAATRDADDVTSQDGGKRKVQTTKVEPFNLSKPKPRTIPEPFAIKLENPYAKPIPKSVFMFMMLRVPVWLPVLSA